VSGSNISIPNNYWCTNDSSIVSTHIYDGYDNPNLSLVHFMPIDTIGCYLTSGIFEPISSIKNNILIYPNPVTDILQIQTDVPIKEIEITDITGRLLYTTTAKTINCSNYASGVYFIKATTEKGVAVKKFIKE
jgi:hypothetical protein